jgi:hypothetical protein
LGCSASQRVSEDCDGGGGEKVGGIAVFDASVAKERTRFSIKAVERETAVFGVDVDWRKD